MSDAFLAIEASTDPRHALDAAELAEVRGASPLGELLPVLRHCLGALAHDARHVLVVADETGRILWIEGSSRVRHRADGITFTEARCRPSAGTNASGTALAATTRSRSSPPSTSCPSSTPGGARRRRSTTPPRSAGSASWTSKWPCGMSLGNVARSTSRSRALARARGIAVAAPAQRA